MRWLLILCTFACCLLGSAQVIENPVFDRTDQFTFRVKKVEITKDSTIVYCIYNAEAGTWANISEGTILRDCITKKKYQLLHCIGLPYAPQRKSFFYQKKQSVILTFPKIPSSITKFDIIESIENNGFNIYGIDLQHENNKVIYSYSLERSNSLATRAEFFSLAKHYHKAIELEKLALDIKKVYLGCKSNGYAMSVRNLASYYNLAGDYTNAVIWGKQDLDLCAEIFGTQNETYGISLLNLASFCHSAERYKDAEKYERQAVELFRNQFSEENGQYATAINYLVQTLYAQGQYNDAIALGERGLKIREKIFGKESIEYSMSLHSLSLCYAAIGDIPKAISLLNNAITIKEKVLGKYDPSYIASLNNLADFYSQKNEFETAKNLELLVVDLSETVYGSNHLEYAKYVDNLSNYYLKLGKITEANQYHEISKKIMSKVSQEYNVTRGINLNNLSMHYYYKNDYHNAIKYGRESLDFFNIEDVEYRTVLSNIANSYSKLNDYNNAISYLHQAIDALKYQMNREYNSLDYESKYLFWQANHSLIDDVYPIYVNHVKNETNLSDLYNAILFSKNIMCEQDIVDHITWSDIQEKMHEEDIAIEFISPSNVSNDTIFYYALTIRKGQKSPKMISLFNGEQLVDSLQCAISNYDKNLKVSHLVWEPLKEQLKDVRNIYFSASHILHVIPIEYLPINSKEYISDCYSIFRLSSTSIIALQGDKKQHKKAAIFGGLNYEQEPNILVNKKIKQRSGFEQLFQTEPEVCEICELLHRSGIDYKAYLKDNGTEESFKSLSGTNLDIIHIATHGEYVNHGDIKYKKDKDNYQFLPANDDNYSFYQSNGLSCSFLVMSGGNKLTKKISSQTNNDGILTALEISNLDLSNVDLVSLSACESGVGAYGADDTVLGLPKAFKLAGANTVLMCLTKVDDEIAKLFMVEFYKNLMSGKTKNQSLKNAQKYLRGIDNGKYDDFKYWASFIMLDGLN